MIYIEILLIIITIASGIILRKRKDPYPTGILTAHKLSSLGAIAVAGFMFEGIFPKEEPAWGGLLVLVLLCITAVSLISGALHSFEKTRIPFVIYLHKATSYLAVAAYIFVLTYN